MPQHHVTVCRPVRLQMASVHGPRSIDAELRYAANDPFAIEVLFHTGDEEPVRWVFARDLLAAGLVGCAGEGDVSVTADLGEDGERVVALRLSSPEGLAVLMAPSAEVSDFLGRSYQLVPAGLESEHLRIDDVVDALLSR